ncbi:hypothetical protein F5B22DRAFT_582538 [Xylaria bambusicola]|uniref:uncharacterized protein n=1 Tax=Xylaria bambusicola TaxID=326684 RepID=UPI002007C22C|nr:uncharacterized protein F5B22DRAFT_582538 [Xylaria bambusicola]KAI0527836.1 hypothetical protein F5B22DRAFT_582538 [Xylaria bambusicola]
MVSPIGVGDAIAIAKLSWFLYQAFVTGRRSAPSEFRRVEDQLHSLSIALFAVDTVKENEFRDHCLLQQQFNQVLINCRNVLEHLQEAVNDHSVIVEPTSPDQPRFRRWTKRCLSTWKRISWTVDRHGLTALVDQITAHTNSLNLLLLVANSSRTRQIRDQQHADSELNVENKSMLQEIYDYYVANLKNSRARQSHTDGMDSVDERRVLFELHQMNEGITELVCPQTSLELDLEAPHLDLDRLFACHCMTPEQAGAHTRHLAAFQLSDLSFAVRLAGDELCWQLLQVKDSYNGQLVNLMVKNMHSKCVREFEQNFVKPLGKRVATLIFSQGTDSLLAYLPPSGEQGKVLSVFNDLDPISGLIEDVTFTVGHTSYTRDSINQISLLMYESLADDAIRNSYSDLHQWVANGNAEIVIYYEEDHDSMNPDDIVRTDIKFSLATSIHLNTSDANSAVQLENIECVSIDRQDAPSRVEGATVTFHTSTPDGARQLHTKIKAILKELLALQIRFPRQDEEIIYSLQSVSFKNAIVDISDGELIVTRNVTGDHRLIIYSRDGCTTLSSELKPEFFKEGGQGSVFSAPADVIQLQNRGVRKIMRYKEGFQANNFGNTNSAKMIELARKTIAASLPIRTINVD